MAFIRVVIRECKVYGVIAFVVVTVWVYAQSNALELRVERMSIGGQWEIPSIDGEPGGGDRLAEANVEDVVEE